MDAPIFKEILDEQNTAKLANLYESENPAPEIVELILGIAVEGGASDILFEPYAAYGLVRARIDGILHVFTKIPIEAYPPVISRIKVLAGLDITQHRIAQEGKITYEYNDRNIELRLAITEVGNGEMAVMRVHDSKTAVYPLSDLGIQEPTFSSITNLLKLKNGLLLTCGPTGSGKTSTLYSAIQTLNQGRYNIISIEDPVEYQLPGINQMQVDKERGITFAEGLKVTLRLNPDIIFVGEIRDAETAHIAIESALTGHLVLSTMHANSAVSAIFRLQDLEVEKFFINSALVGVISQRLVRRVCESCGTETAPTNEEVQFYQKITGKTLVSQRQGSGCTLCSMTGYHGRIGIYEVLVIDDMIRTLVSHNATEQQIRAFLDQRGFVSIVKDGLNKVDQKLTTVSEVITNAYVNG
jgi:type II secretory ATPase GspE/PulE/Tfp pilus assembly ATPase PilB-like protein